MKVNKDVCHMAGTETDLIKMFATCLALKQI
jgi:hypothetical protein